MSWSLTTLLALLLCTLSFSLPPHPRLLMTDDDFQRVKNYLANNDATATKYYNGILSQGNNYLTVPPVADTWSGDMLNISREVLKREYVLSTLFRIDGSQKWADRGVEEMLAVGQFPTWNPDHFLDVAEMTHAFAIGYDWLYSATNSSSRSAIETAIINLGLKIGLQNYQAGAWWANDTFNWNIVCNGGLTIGALAVLDIDPDTAYAVMNYSKPGLPHSVKSFAPDGAWPEGTMYWGYASRYLGPTIGSLLTALNDDWGLSNMTGVVDNSLFPMYSMGPTRQFFDWADAETNGDINDFSWLYYWARHYGDSNTTHKAYLYFVRNFTSTASGGSISSPDLLFYDDIGTVNDLESLPLNKFFSHDYVGIFRQNWTDSTSTFLGFKGGNNQYNHGDLDQGTFVFDLKGQRWAIDLGSDNYGLPDYWDMTSGPSSGRWQYYRKNTTGHNTLMFNNQNQNIYAISTVPVFNTSSESTKFSIVDLSQCYSNYTSQVQRGFALLFNHQQLLVQDEIAANTQKTLSWSMHTMANITIDATETIATLTFTNSPQKLQVKILDESSNSNCNGAKISWENIDLPPPQNPSPGLHNVLITAPASTCSRLVVTMGESLEDIVVNPLSQWNTMGPIKT